MPITPETLDAVAKDREGIVRDYIAKNCMAGRNAGYLMAEVDAIVRVVFYEPGWDVRIEQSINALPEVFVRSFDGAAR